MTAMPKYFFLILMSLSLVLTAEHRDGDIDELAEIYGSFEPGLHLARRTLYKPKKFRAILSLAVKADCKHITLDIKTPYEMTPRRIIENVRQFCRKNQMRFIGRWVMFKYAARAPVPFLQKNGTLYRSEGASYANPLMKKNWEINFFGRRIKKQDAPFPDGIVNYIGLVDEMELDYIRYPSTGLNVIRYRHSVWDVRRELKTIGLPGKEINRIAHLPLTKMKDAVINAYLSHYLSRKEFGGGITVDVIGSVLFNRQNIGQHGILTGHYRIKPMLYLDRLHVPETLLYSLIQTILKHNAHPVHRPLSRERLMKLATIAHLKLAVTHYPHRPAYYLMPYVKGWKNRGESDMEVRAAFLGQLKALEAMDLKRFTVWAVSLPVSRLLVKAAEKHRAMKSRR